MLLLHKWTIYVVTAGSPFLQTYMHQWTPFSLSAFAELTLHVLSKDPVAILSLQSKDVRHMSLSLSLSPHPNGLLKAIA